MCPTSTLSDISQTLKLLCSLLTDRIHYGSSLCTQLLDPLGPSSQLPWEPLAAQRLGLTSDQGSNGMVIGAYYNGPKFKVKSGYD